MRAIWIRFGLTLFFIVGGIGLYSCCKEVYRYTGESTMQIFPAAKHIAEIDTVRGPFDLAVHIGYESMARAASLSFSSTAYAMTCATEFQNLFDSTTARLTLDRPFAVGGDTVFAGTDITPYFLRRAHADPYEFAYCYYQFSSDHLASARFDTGWHTFTFEGRLSDGAMLQCAKRVYIQL